jgi:6-phosphogluconolactonase
VPPAESNQVNETDESNETSGATPVVRVVPDMAALTRAAYELLTDAALAAVVHHGRCSIALAGGETPRALYELIAADDSTRLPWNLVDVWFGDERCVPPDDAASNYLMARETLLARVPVPPENVRRIRGELGAAAAADAYDEELRAAFGDPGTGGAGAPTFDLALLGIGTEGHTASLFPGHAALDVTDRWAVAVDPAPETAKPQVPRVTLTLPALAGAREVVVLAAGAEKRDIVRAVQAGESDLPAARVRGRERTVWIVDREAS